MSSGIGLMPVSGSGIAGQVPPSRPGVAKLPAAESVLWTPEHSAYTVGWLDTDQGMTIDGSNQITDWVARVGDFGLDPFTDQEPTRRALGYTFWECGTGDAFDEDSSHGGDWLTFSKGKEEVWIFAIFRPSGGGRVDNRTIVSISTGTSSVSSRMILMLDDEASSPPNNLQVGGRVMDADSYSATLGDTDLIADSRTTMVVAGCFSPGRNLVQAWVDDVLDDEDTTWQSGLDTAFESTDALDVTVGDDNLMGGDIVIAAGGAGFMTDDLRQRYFAYLAHEAGIQSQLPASNPYKSAPPMT